MAHPNDIKTTSGKTFTHAQSAQMAKLIFARFGEDLEAATAAWNRLLQNNCTPTQFKKLLEEK